MNISNLRDQNENNSTYKNQKCNLVFVEYLIPIPWPCFLFIIVSCLFVAGFKDMYDPEGYSLWFCDYKYNDEKSVSFVTLNKVGGCLQKMDLARKYALWKMLMIGSEPAFKVKGLWFFRGLEIPQFVLDECYDMELYDWKKIDIIDEDQKERVN